MISFFFCLPVFAAGPPNNVPAAEALLVFAPNNVPAEVLLLGAPNNVPACDVVFAAVPNVGAKNQRVSNKT